MLALLALFGGLGLLDAYLFTAGPHFSIWLLPLIPLLGSLTFGALLLRQLRNWRRQVALVWLARPARLRPDAERVARQLARTPWHLLWLPPLLLSGAFVSVVATLSTGARPTLGVLLGPVFVSLLIQAAVAALQGWRTIRQTRALISGLPLGLVPSQATTGPLWQLYRYY